jgi:AbrB family looped-hinge helix DNA binding protein
MSRVTSKLQVTIPKTLADRYGIRPGDEIEWEPAGAYIRIIPPRRQARPFEREERLRLFDEATARQREREEAAPVLTTPADDRGWTREELYVRGSAR